MVVVWWFKKVRIFVDLQLGFWREERELGGDRRRRDARRVVGEGRRGEAVVGEKRRCKAGGRGGEAT